MPTPKYNHCQRYDFTPGELEQIDKLLQSNLLQAYIQNALAEEILFGIQTSSASDRDNAIKQATVQGAVILAEKLIRTEAGA